ncbi:MAG: dihydrolipoyllysine-residue acetyltransferase [Geminicoccaceae bacterium]
MSDAQEVVVPDIGDFEEVEIIEVHVSSGDELAEEDPVITLESDKASMEVPSPGAGKVVEVKVSVGDKVSEGDLILTLEGGEASAPVDPPSPEGHQESDSQPIEAPEKDAPGPKPLKSSKAPDFSDVHASPAVRRLARELEIDLNKIEGSGEKNRITKEDVKAFLGKGNGKGQAPAASSGAGIPEIPAVDFSKFGETETKPLSRIKKISGPHLHRAWLNIPAVTHGDEADITETDAYRKELDAAAKEQGYRITLLSFLIKASVSGMKKFPEFNSSLAPDKENLILKKYFNIGIAVDTADGLVVPVVKDADKKGIDQISRDLAEMSQKARDGKLQSSDLQGGCFTISSLGGIGGTDFSPIVNPPEVAIMGVVRSKMAPVWDGEAFVPRNMLPIYVTYDHRVIDGALAARFTRHVCHVLEDVRRLVL